MPYLQVKSPDFANALHSMCSALLRRTAVIYRCRIKWLAFLMGTHCCLSELRTELLYIMWSICSLKVIFLSSGGYSSTCHCGVPGWRPANPYEVYTGCRVTGKVFIFYPSTLVPPVSIIPLLLHTHIHLNATVTSGQAVEHGDLDTKTEFFRIKRATGERGTCTLYCLQGLIL
jgi:hypothetical protein